MRVLYGLVSSSLGLGPESLNASPRQLVTELSDEMLQYAGQICFDFYASLDQAPSNSTVYNEFLAEGGQSWLFRCGTNDTNISPSITASKIYKTVFDKNMTEIELINTAAADAGVRAPVYYFHGRGFIEEFLTGKSNMWESQAKGGLSLTDEEVWSNVARLIAKLHSTEIDSIDKERYTRLGATWWNTRHIEFHFEQLFRMLGSGIAQHTYEDMLSAFKISTAELQAEYRWTAEVVDEYYENNETPVLCHNDDHAGNIMIQDGDQTGESLILIDFDNAHYGYRAFDFIYFFNYMAITYADEVWRTEQKGTIYYPSEDVRRKWLTVYNEEYTGPDSNSTTVDKLVDEVTAYSPYLLLEQMVFFYGITGTVPGGLFCEYERYNRIYNRETAFDLCSSAKISSMSFFLLAFVVFCMKSE